MGRLKRPRRLKHMRNNWFQKLPMHQRIIKTTYNCKYPLPPETTPFTWVPSLWDLQRVSQPELFSILGQNTSPLQVHSAMIKPRAILNSRNTTHYQVRLSNGINWMKDARHRHTTCINQTPIRFCLRHLLNWHMVQLSCRVSSGRIIPAFSHSREIQIA